MFLEIGIDNVKFPEFYMKILEKNMRKQISDKSQFGKNLVSLLLITNLLFISFLPVSVNARTKTVDLTKDVTKDLPPKGNTPPNLWSGKNPNKALLIGISKYGSCKAPQDEGCWWNLNTQTEVEKLGETLKERF